MSKLNYSQTVQDHRAWQTAPSQADEEPPAAQEEQARQAPVRQGPGSTFIQRQADRAFAGQAPAAEVTRLFSFAIVPCRLREPEVLKGQEHRVKRRQRGSCREDENGTLCTRTL